MESGAVLRLSVFVTVFVVLGAAEAFWPRRNLAFGRVLRWPANLGLSVLNTALLRLSFLLIPALSVIAAVYAEARGWGFLAMIGVSGWAALVLAFVILDFAIYAQHVAFHFVPPFWRLHRVHHADPDIDISTGVRFHPLEILISQGWKIAVVLAVGAPALAVIAFEIALNATSMFSHANLRLPARLDAVVRWAIVTPDMHRVHHSTVNAEMNSNFGFNFSVWDRVFATYRAQPALAHESMAIGLESYRGALPTQFLWLLWFPFARGRIT